MRFFRDLWITASFPTVRTHDPNALMLADWHDMQAALKPADAIINYYKPSSALDESATTESPSASPAIAELICIVELLLTASCSILQTNQES